MNVTAVPSAAGFAEETRVSVVERSFQPPPLTRWTKTGENTGGALAVPVKRTVIACDPAARLDVVNVARPEAIDPDPTSMVRRRSNWISSPTSQP